MIRIWAVLFLFFVLIPARAPAESVYVKYGGKVDLSHFVCEDETQSIAINNVCYDVANNYMLVSLNGAYYQYCTIDPETIAGLLTAPAADRYFSMFIKGQFACRADNTPTYESGETSMSSSADTGSSAAMGP